MTALADPPVATWTGWHFLPADRRLRYGDGRLVVEGETLTVPETTRLELCKSGMHASPTVHKALEYAPGNVLCRVELIGERASDQTKSCARARRTLWMRDAESVLRAWAYWCADRAVRIHAVKALRAAGLNKEAESLACLREITDEETRAASSAASSAAYSAAYYAAYSAASSAAYSAAYSAASSAASSAAYYAAYSAAYSAASFAAYSAASSAEAAFISDELERRCLALENA